MGGEGGGAIQFSSFNFWRAGSLSSAPLWSFRGLLARLPRPTPYRVVQCSFLPLPFFPFLNQSPVEGIAYNRQLNSSVLPTCEVMIKKKDKREKTTPRRSIAVIFKNCCFNTVPCGLVLGPTTDKVRMGPGNVLRVYTVKKIAAAHLFLWRNPGKLYCIVQCNYKSASSLSSDSCSF